MTQRRSSGWLQIDLVDTTVSVPITSNILNDTTSYSGVNNSTYEQVLTLKPESQESGLLLVNVLITCSLILVVILHGIFRQSKKAGLSGLFALACLSMTAVIGPIVGSILLILACYRQCVLTILKLTSKRGTFGGLMKGNDAFWALEEESSRSVINILALADFSFIVEASCNNEEPLRTVQELIEDRLLSHPSPFPKLLCYRQHYLGYFYWERQSNISVADHVRWMEIDDQSCSVRENKKYFTESHLKNYVSSMSNSPLPAGHLSGWEILIGRYPVSMDSSRISDDDVGMLDKMENGENYESAIKYPVLFRVHHSLGDGVALVRLLLDALADPCTRTPSRTPTPTFECNNIPSILINDHSNLNGNQSVQCESTCLNIPTTINYMEQTNMHAKLKPIQKSVSLNFNDWSSKSMSKYREKKSSITPSTSLRDCVRTACHKFINLIEETSQLNKLQYQTQSLQNINILINDIPVDNSGAYDISDKALEDVTITTELNEIFNESELLHNHVTKEDRRRFQNLFVECNEKNDNEYNNVLTYRIRLIFDIIKEKFKLIKDMLYHLVILTLLPATVVNQVLTRTYDQNALHGPKLSGYKVVGWYLENTFDEDKCLMTMIKNIRRHTDAHFSDVILTALSLSLETFYGRFHDTPDVVTAVIPARLGRPNRDQEYNAKVMTAKIKTKDFNAKITKLCMDTNAKRNHSVLYETSKTSLENKFSVALLTIPIARKSADEEPFTRLKQVQNYTSVLRKSADYLVNYWILNVVATVFPIPLLRNMVQSTQSSLVVSNMPGPQTLAKLAGHLLHNIVFWVPNKETTGVGITILSYSGRLQIGIIADRALIPCSEDAQLIVDGIVSAIKEMNNLSSAEVVC